MNSRSVEYSEKSLKKALDLQKKLDANYGGTEILAPLEAIYKKDVISTHSRQVLSFKLNAHVHNLKDCRRKILGASFDFDVIFMSSLKILNVKFSIALASAQIHISHK